MITFLQTQRVGEKKEIFEPPLHYSDEQMNLRQYYKTISNTDSSYENCSEEHLEERRAALELYLNSLLTKLVSIHNIIKNIQSIEKLNHIFFHLLYALSMHLQKLHKLLPYSVLKYSYEDIM